MAVFAMALPIAKAIFVSLDKAPNDICEIYTGPERIIGLLAFLPITVVVTTGASSSRGIGLS